MRSAGCLGATLAVAAMAYSAPADAAPEVVAEVDGHSAVVGDSFTVRFVVKTEDRRAGRFQQPTWRSLKLVGQSQQTRMQIVNGQVSQSLIYDFQVRATRPGVIVIPAARYQDRTGLGRSRPLNVRVEAAKKPAAPSPGRSGGLNLDGADVALVATVDKDEVVKGEQMTLTYTLYTQVRISEYSMDEPEIPGFWKEDLTPARQPKFHRRMVGGVAYEAAVVRRYLLFPLKVGQRFIPSTQMRVEKSRGAFRTQTVSRRSNSLNLHVAALPQGAPRGFTGAVGRFQIKVSADRAEGQVGMPVGVQVRLSGRGNFKHFDLKLPNPPDGLRAHPPTATDRVGIQQGRMTGEKVFEWILTPERAGRFNLGAMRFPYFDPTLGEYKTTVASPVSLRVKPAPGATTPGGAPAPGASVGAIAQREASKLRPLKTDLALRPPQGPPDKPPWGRPGLVWLFLLTPALWLGLAIRDRLQERRLATTDERVTRGAMRRAKRRLHDARVYAADGPTSKLYGELARTLIGYIDDRTGGRTAGMSFGELGHHLAAAGYPDEDVMAVMAELENADAARFTPTGSSPTEMQASLDRIKALVRRLDKHAPLDRSPA